MHNFSLNYISRSHFFCSSKNTKSEYERDYRNDNEDYHQPFCDLHGETRDPSQSHNEKNQRKNKKNYCEID